MKAILLLTLLTSAWMHPAYAFLGLGIWIGFDLMKYDFVHPYGTGSVSDMEVMFEWDGAWQRKKYNGIALKFRFCEKYSGGYYCNKIRGSALDGIYNANPGCEFQQEF